MSTNKPFWSVAIEGEKHDLSYWVALLEPPNFPNVSIIKVPKPDSTIEFTHSLRIEPNDIEEMSEYWKLVDKTMAELNGIFLSHCGTEEVSAAHLLQHLEDGKILRHHRMLVDTGHYKLRFGLIASTAPSEPKLSMVQRAFNEFSESELRAVNYISNADDWAELYKAFEALGKTRKLQKLGISKSELISFSQNANNYRHDTTRHTEPEVPMTFHEGKKFIQNVIKKLMQRTGK